MATEVQEAIREMTESMLKTLEALAGMPEAELRQPSHHVCAQGKDVWTLLTNDIDHEKIHSAQILEGRYESARTQGRFERLVTEWLVERARLISSLVGLSDEEFDRPAAPGGWTYREIVNHVRLLEVDSLRNINEAINARGRSGQD